jgi:hypothetical protein
MRRGLRFGKRLRCRNGRRAARWTPMATPLSGPTGSSISETAPEPVDGLRKGGAAAEAGEGGVVVAPTP